MLYNPAAAEMPAQPTPELAIVIPVYNEAQNLPALLRDWQPVFKATGVPYRIFLIDDGSTDGSLSLLRSMQQTNPTLSVHTQKNAGHGPAILKGYHLATAASPSHPQWVFQIDSDHQLDTAPFPELWNKRHAYDFLLAQRSGKNASAGRRIISNTLRVMVRSLYGKGVADVNCPYRLLRAETLKKALEKIPSGSFAPNVLITAWFILKKKKIFTTVVNRRGQRLRPSRLNSYFIMGAIKSSLQTLVFRIRYARTLKARSTRNRDPAGPPCPSSPA